MHASVEQLLSLRDGAPVLADIVRHVAGCGDCSGELERLRLVRTGLRELPPVAAPPAGWTAIAGELDAPRKHRRGWVAVAAAGLVAGIVGWALLPGAQSDLPGSQLAAGEPEPAGIDSLVAESRQLEELLRTLDRASPRIMSAGTAETIAGLQDGIAVIDYGLTYDEQMSGAASQRLWRQRVDLMNSLVQVRGAQLQRVSN